jgi:hypothetical protein
MRSIYLLCGAFLSQDFNPLANCLLIGPIVVGLKERCGGYFSVVLALVAFACWLEFVPHTASSTQIANAEPKPR